jgi:hypothetical protein
MRQYITRSKFARIKLRQRILNPYYRNKIQQEAKALADEWSKISITVNKNMTEEEKQWYYLGLVE